MGKMETKLHDVTMENLSANDLNQFREKSQTFLVFQEPSRQTPT